MHRSFYAAGLFTVIASLSSFAQTTVGEAKVPFDFHVGGVSLPAGDYIVQQSRGLITIRGQAGKPTVMQLSLPASRPHKASNASLLFQRYGNDYFLARIWNADSTEGCALPKSKQETELARRATFGKTEDVALRTNHRPGDDLR